MPRKPTAEVLLGCVPTIAAWMIQAAKQRRGDLTYGQIARRLESEFDLSRIFATRIGMPVGVVMDRIREIDPKAPLLNVLVVRADTFLPGSGAGEHMARRFRKPVLAQRDAPTRHRELWKRSFEAAAAQVFAYDNWDELYRKTFGQALPDDPLTDPSRKAEQDGLDYGRSGEGENHKRLRLWVKDNPKTVWPGLDRPKPETEYLLDSADRVDVIYLAEGETIAIEVKSRDSNDLDLRRGIFQCVKYRAVLEAMAVEMDVEVIPLLVTERDLPPDLQRLARQLDIKTKTIRLRKTT